MSGFKKVFGGGNKKTSKKRSESNKTPTASEAIQKLHETEDMLLKKQTFLERKIEQELAIARKNGTKNKRVALQALKNKKKYEKQLEQVDGTLSTLEFQREALENANTNTEVLNNMAIAAQALQKAHQNMDVDKVHDLMDDVAEQQDVAREISEAISNPGVFGNDIDEDDLERELAELEQEELEEQMSKTDLRNLPAPPSAAPKAKPRKKVEDDDDDMNKLAAWAT